MSWWTEKPPLSSARVLRGPRVSAIRPASLLVDPEKLRLYRIEREAQRVNGNGHVSSNGHAAYDEQEEELEEAPVEVLAPVVDEAQQAAELEKMLALVDLARSEGHAEGMRTGVEQGAAAMRAEMQASVDEAESERTAQVSSAAAALLSAVESVEEARAQAVVVAERECAELAFKLTRSLLGRETHLSESPTVDSIVRALALAPTNEAVVIRLNPDDIATLTGFDMSALGREATVVADESVEHGGCVVEVGPTKIDAQLGRALGRVRKALLGMGHPHDEHVDDMTGTVGELPEAAQAAVVATPRLSMVTSEVPA